MGSVHGGLAARMTSGCRPCMHGVIGEGCADSGMRGVARGFCR
jgi:hypothetical protein